MAFISVKQLIVTFKNPMATMTTDTASVCEISPTIFSLIQNGSIHALEDYISRNTSSITEIDLVSIFSADYFSYDLSSYVDFHNIYIYIYICVYVWCRTIVLHCMWRYHVVIMLRRCF